MVIKLLYCGYFGGGNNINMNWLDQNGLWPKPESNVYPTAFRLSPRECIKIWQQANRNIPQIFG